MWCPAMSSFQSAIPSMVRLAESAHARDMWLRSMLIRSRALAGNDFQAGDRFFPLPIDYLGMEGLWAIKNDESRLRLIQVSPSSLQPGSSSLCEFIVHQEIEFNSALSDEQVLEMLYYRKFSNLSVTNQTNWLIDNYYEAYLYPTVGEAFMFQRDEDTANIWLRRYQQVVSSILEKDRRSKWTQSEMAVSMNAVIDEVP